MNLTQIIAAATTRYTTSRTNAQQVASILTALRNFYRNVGRLCNQPIMIQDITVANQIPYSLPTDCRVSDIVNMTIQLADTISNDLYTDIKYLEDTEIGYDKTFWTRSPSQTKYLLYENGAAITENGRDIIFNYWPRPYTFDSSDMTTVPKLDEEYHDFLVFWLLSENASVASDYDKANFYMQSALEIRIEAKKHMENELYVADTLSHEISEGW